MITGPWRDFEARCQERGYTLPEVEACIVSRDGEAVTVNELHPAYPRIRTAGPGTELKSLLASIGITASPTCKCNKMARQMDSWGPDESLKHTEEIVDVMQETAKARKLPFLRLAGRRLVRMACARARKKTADRGQ